MRELAADIWELRELYSNSFIGIPVNMTVRRNGLLVMGAGVARQARDRFPELPGIWGGFYAGNCGIALNTERRLFAFPTKRHWSMSASPALIEMGTKELRYIARHSPDYLFYLPRPGCGYGKLAYRETVRPLLLKLPDNVIIVSK